MAVNKRRVNVEIMKKQLADLQDEKEAVKHYIEDTNRSGPDQIELQTLTNWLTSAKDLIKAAQKLLIDVKKDAKQKSFFSLCLNPKSPYQISKQAERSSKDIAELVQVARRFNIPLSYYLKNSVAHGFESFESREDVIEEILETLQIRSVNKIGVHGLPGVGKTMLMREVKRQAEEEKLFDVVVMATVGRNPDFPRIQVEIARGLGLGTVSNELTSQDQDTSNQIKARLTEKEVLVILDDIWAPGIDLEELGIPLGGRQKPHGLKKKEDSLSCKILLTSRDPNVLLNQMGAEKNFAIEPLTEIEAWELFTRIAFELAESRSLQVYVTEIAKEFEGLPLSIAMLANCLKSRTVVEWDAAVQKLKSQSQENLLEIPKCLRLAVELSYGGLESEKLQQTFLLCSLMGHNATIKDLLKYGMGLGLFPRVKSMEEARDEALTLVSKLKHSFLLVDGGSNVQFDMHDFVRVIALSIASQDHGMLASRDEDAPIDWQDNKANMEKLKWIFSSNFNSSRYQLPGELKCPQLTFFHLSNEDPSPAIPPNLFRETEGLKVLGLIKLHFFSIPSSISLPKNLHTLCLDQSVLESVDIGPILGNLKNLQVLSLVGCDIQELPEEVGKLIRLKFLDLSDCTKLKVIPPGVLSSLSRLEELYLGNSFPQWDYSQEQQNQRNASLVELTELKNLTTLEVSICDIQMFQKVSLSTKLKQYKIFIGDVWNYWDSSFENSKILKLKLDASIHFDHSIRELLKTTDELHLEVLNGVKDIVSELDDSGFQQLKYLHVMNYPEIQYLFNDSVKGIFPNLEVFVLHNLMSLEKIFHDQSVQTSLNKLRIINVEHCNQLKNLFSFSIAKQLFHLQEITVVDCSNIVEIVDDERQGSTNDGTKETDVLELAQLQCLRLQHLPEFISFSLEDDTSSRFTSLFNKKVSFPNLKWMTISHLKNSKKICQELSKNSFCNLKSLRVAYCQNLSAIFPSNNDMPRELLKSLEKLEIIGCSSLKEIDVLSSIRILMLDSLDNLRDIFIQDLSGVLQTLKVWRCDSLNCLSTTELVSFKNLTTLNVQECHGMTTLVSVKVAQSLVQLVHMTIRECQNLTQIVGSDSPGGEDSVISFSKLRFLKLEFLSRLESFYSKNFKLEFPSLKRVFVYQCPKLKIFSEGYVNMPMLRRLELIEGEDKWYWSGDLNTTVQRMCTKKVGFVGLKDMIFQDFPELMEIRHSRSPEEILDFRQLECLELYDCNNFKYLLTPSMVLCLVQLQSIMVKSCVTLEQVIMGDGEEYKVFPQLRLIRLESCSNLVTFYAGSYGLEIPALANIIVNNCPKMLTFAASTSSEEASQYFFSSKVAFPRLQQLTIEFMGSLNKIWDTQYDGDSWWQLNSIIVEACEKLLNIFPFGMLERLQKLEKLEIRNCYSLEEIVEYQELGASPSQAQITTQPILVETTTRFVFPKLTHLSLFKLPKLNSFCRQMHTIEWPSLKKLEVHGCHQVKIFASEFPSLPRTNGNNQLEIGTKSPLFWVRKVAFPNLEVFVLYNSIKLEKIFHGQTSVSKLRIINVEHCNQLKNLFSFSMAKQLLHLQEITVKNCSNIVEIVNDEGRGSTNDITEGIDVLELVQLQCLRLQNLPEFISINHEDDTSSRFTSLFNKKVTFPNLKMMTISHLENSAKIWQELSENSSFNLKSLSVAYCQNLSTSFPSDNDMLRKLLKSLEKLEIIGCTSVNKIEILSTIRILVLDSLDNLRHILNQDSSSVLQTLEVRQCDSLTSLFTSELESFKNLTTLNVQGCHCMTTLVSVKAAQSLVQLVCMTVRKCKNMTKIVGSDGLGTEDSIIHFIKLKLLKLECLSRLESFCSGRNFLLKFPSLEKAVVDQCPKLKIFSEGHASTPMLQRVELTEGEDKSYWSGNLNTTIQRMCTEKVGFVGLKDLILQDFPELMEIWHTTRNPQEILDFGRLECLELYDCNNFKYLLTPSMVFYLVQLQSIIVKSCAMLEQVIMGDGKESKMIFPKLGLIKLESCLDLASFYAGSYGLEIPALTNIIVNYCPKMHTFAASTSSEEATQYFFSSKVAFPRLQQLTIESMGSLNKIWDNKHDANSWCLLNSIIVEACEKLLNIFPFSMLERLQELEKLEIRNCNSLEEIFEYQELASCQSQAQITTQPTLVKTTTKFVFPKLTHLNLFMLPKLNCFCRQMHTIEWPSLKKLEVYGCHQVQIFASEFPSFQGTIGNNQHEIGTKSPLCWVSKVAFPNLEVFVLYNSIKLEKIFHGQFAQTSFLKLKIINVDHCNQLKNLFSFSIAKQLLHLHEISVADCSNIVQIVNDEGQGSTDEIYERTDVLELAQLQCLRLQNLPEFICFSHEDDTSSRFTSVFNKKVAFPNLKMMTISHLENSTEILQELSENSFFNLKSLRVTSCQNLSTIYPSDNDMLRKLLKSLEELQIIGCTSVKEIEILSSIRILMLDSLDNLRHILSQDSSSVLQTLEVRQCNSLTSLCTSKLASFKNLTTLNVQGCHCMTTLVSVKAAQSMGQLERVTVWECKNLTKIVESQNLGNEDWIILFRKLKLLKLECLPRLESFYSWYLKEFQSLEKVVVAQCPKLKIFSEGYVSTPMLQRVELTDGEDKWYWTRDLNSTIQKMYTEKVGFVGLKDLILQDFPELMEMWHTTRNPQEILDFGRLECLELYDCNNFKYLLTPSMVFCLVQLQSIIVKGCAMLEQVILGDGEESKMIFPQLWLVRLESCSDLTTFYVGSYSLEIPALANIIVNDCPKMLTFAASTSSEEASQYFFSCKVAFPRLQQLTITSLGSLNKIWDSQRDADSWCQLNTIIVDTCGKLLNVFPFNMLERLLKLEKLEIRNCNSLEKIFDYQELDSSQSQAQIATQPTSVETTTKFVFPKLTHLDLFMLPKLNCFCPQMHITEWPSLKKLEVYGCHQVPIIASEFASFQGTNGNNQLKIGIESPLFWVSKATFPNLKELKLKGNESMKEIWRGQNPGCYFPKLEVLELQNLDEQSSAAIPPLFIQSLPHLEKLVVKNTSFNEIFPCQRLDIGADAPPQLTELRLFGNLQTLEVFQCHGLKNLVKYSITESLVQLRTMSIISCNMIEEILVCDGDGVKDDIIFTKLKHLHLKDLRNLKCFCSGNCNFQFPSLQDVIVSDCLKLDIFTKGKVSTTKLQKVKFGENYERLWGGDLNTKIKFRRYSKRDSIILRKEIEWIPREEIKRIPRERMMKDPIILREIERIPRERIKRMMKEKGERKDKAE